MKKISLLLFSGILALSLGCFGGDDSSSGTPAGTASLTLSDSTVMVGYSKTVDITAAAITASGSNDTITAVSSDNAKATVAVNGLTITIIGVSIGDATITVTSGSGETAECVVSIESISMRCIKKVRYQTDLSTIQSYISFSYDTNGNLIKWTNFDSSGVDSTWFTGDDSITAIPVWARWNIDWGGSGYVVNEFNTSGEVTKSSLFDGSDIPNDYFINEYNIDKQLIKKSGYHSSNTLDGYYTYEYNASGQLIKISEYNAVDALLNYQVYEYNSNGKGIKISTYLSGDTLNEYKTWEYNSDGKLIRISEYNAVDALLHYGIFEYNSLGQLVSSTAYDGADNFEEIVKFYYNENGNMIYRDEFNDVNQTNQTGYETWEYEEGPSSDATIQYIDNLEYFISIQWT